MLNDFQIFSVNNLVGLSIDTNSHGASAFIPREMSKSNNKKSHKIFYLLWHAFTFHCFVVESIRYVLKTETYIQMIVYMHVLLV